MIAGALVAAVLTSSVVGLTAPAAITTPADDAYISVVRGGLSPTHQAVSDDVLRGVAYGVCEDLDDGWSQAAVVDQIMTGFNQESPTDPLTPEETGYVVGASIGAYCPSHHDDPMT